MGRISPLEVFFKPKSVAIVGASSDPKKPGHTALKNLVSMGYQGKVYPVNNEGGEINGLKAYKSIKEIPGKVDFAILTIPASTVTRALEECLLKEVKGAEILTSGFRETGTPEGKRMEDEIAQIAKRGIRILGPNCFGIYCPESRLTILP